MPKKRFPRETPDKSWKVIIDGWMRNSRIRRACMIFAAFALVLAAVVVLAVVVALWMTSVSTVGGLGGMVANTPRGWITAGGGVSAVGGGIAAVRWFRRRRKLKDLQVRE